MAQKEYKMNINPRILELLGPSLYTNIYYIIAELIANAYDADAENVYIIISDDRITVEDDGTGMSYSNGDINRYLSVAAVSRTKDEDSRTKDKGRLRMGRKGVGKLAALSISEKVLVKTIANGEKSGFVLSRYVDDSNNLDPINDEDITFDRIKNNGTSIVMLQPRYKFVNTLKTIRKNITKIFPMVCDDFKIHIIKGKEEEVADDWNKDTIKDLAALITIGNDFQELGKYFETPYSNHVSKLYKAWDTKSIDINMLNLANEKHDYTVKIDGWIGVYKTTRGRKAELTDFPDNFISLYANKKMGEFNILPTVGQNKLNEVYVVGQLHVDIFELTELPDMALSNRQGYKTDDPRYKAVIDYVRSELLQEILSMRNTYVDLKKEQKKMQEIKNQQVLEDKLKQSVEVFREKTSKNAVNRISERFKNLPDVAKNDIKSILDEEINKNSPDMGLKSIIDSQKKKILISHTYNDKDLADIIYEMLRYNNVPGEDIIYTNCDDEVSRIPEDYGIYDYLRDFFVESYSTEKIYVLFITSEDSNASWGAITEVGAAWITQVDNKIFNINDFRPKHPLDDEKQWHTSNRDKSTRALSMTKLNADIFCQKIEHVCNQLGYKPNQRDQNKNKLKLLVSIV